MLANRLFINAAAGAQQRREEKADRTEEQRLRSTCARRVYSMADAAFGDREEMCFARMALALADMRGLMCELRGLHHVIDALGELNPRRALYSGFVNLTVAPTTSAVRAPQP